MKMEHTPAVTKPRVRGSLSIPPQQALQMKAAADEIERSRQLGVAGGVGGALGSLAEDEEEQNVHSSFPVSKARVSVFSTSAPSALPVSSASRSFGAADLPSHVATMQMQLRIEELERRLGKRDRALA
jgi:hypothetical protein